MFADEPEQIIIFLGRLLGELIERLGSYFRAQDGAYFLVPACIDVVEFLRTSVDQLFDDAPLLVEPRSWKRAALDRIEDAQ